MENKQERDTVLELEQSKNQIILFMKKLTDKNITQTKKENPTVKP
jgi:hypothetical protein